MRKFIFTLLFIPILVFGETYYVDNVSGSNSNSGNSIGNEWFDFTNVHGTLSSGDTLLIKSGNVIYDELTLSAKNNIYVDKYGGDEYYEVRLWTDLPDWNITNTWTLLNDSVWYTTISDPANPERLWVNNSEQMDAESVALIDRNSTWRYDTGNVYLYATSNPAANYNSIEIPYVGSENYCLYVGYSDTITIKHGNFSGGQRSITIRNSNDVLIDSVMWGMRTTQGILWEAEFTGTTFENITISNSYSNTGDSLTHTYYEEAHNTQDAINIRGGIDGLYIYNNEIVNWSHDGIYFISIYELDFIDVHAYNNYIHSEFIDYSRAFNVDVDEFGSNYSIHHNVVEGMTIRSQINGTDYSFNNNVMIDWRDTEYSNGGRETNGQMFSVQGYSQATNNSEAKGNIFFNSPNSGIYYVNGSSDESITNLELSGNVIWNNGTGDQSDYESQAGISILVDISNGNSIHDNTFTNNYIGSPQTNTPIQYYDVMYSVEDWNAAATNGDVVSGNSALTTEPDIYYTTFTSRTMSFPSQRWTDINGNTYDHNLTLEPFESVVIVSKVNVSGNVFNYGGEWWKTSDGKIWNFNKTE